MLKISKVPKYAHSGPSWQEKYDYHIVYEAKFGIPNLKLLKKVNSFIHFRKLILSELCYCCDIAQAKIQGENPIEIKKIKETSAHGITILIFKKMEIVSGSELSRDFFEPGPHIPR